MLHPILIGYCQEVVREPFVPLIALKQSSIFAGSESRSVEDCMRHRTFKHCFGIKPMPVRVALCVQHLELVPTCSN